MLISFALLPCLFEPALVWFSHSSVFMFCQAPCYITAICFVIMLECSSLVPCCMLSSIVLLITVLHHPCFACHLQTVHPFRWSLNQFQSKTYHLSSGTLGLPSWFLDHSFPSGARICIAYHILHIMPCFASCCLRIASRFIVVPLLVFFLWVEPGGEYMAEQPIEYINEDQAIDNPEKFAGKMTIPSKSLLSLIASCSLYCYAALRTTCYIMPPILPCQATNPPFPNKPLFGYVTALLNPSYSVVSCKWRWSLFHMGTWICWDIRISLI